MTRFGVMKHLKILEGPGLVVCRKRGARSCTSSTRPDPAGPRPVDEQVAEPWASALPSSRHSGGHPMTASGTTVSFAEGTPPVLDTAVFEIYIKAAPERIWEALTDPAMRAEFRFGVQTQSDWTTGSTYLAGVPESRHRRGREPRRRPPHLLVQCSPLCGRDDVKAQGTGGSPGGSNRSGLLRLTVVTTSFRRARTGAVRRLADASPASRHSWRPAKGHHAWVSDVRPGLSDELRRAGSLGMRAGHGRVSS